MKSAVDATQKELIIQLRNGSEKAFAQLYKQYKTPVFRYCVMLTKSEELASEMVQQIFISLWLSHKRIDPEESFASYLFTIAKNKVFNYFRDVSRDASMRNTWIQNAELFEDTTERTVMFHECSFHLTKAIERLPDRKKAVFMLSRMEGKSYDEMAEVLGISKNTIKNHLVEATKLVKQYLLVNAGISLPIYLIASLNIILP